MVWRGESIKKIVRVEYANLTFMEEGYNKATIHSTFSMPQAVKRTQQTLERRCSDQMKAIFNRLIYKPNSMCGGKLSATHKKENHASFSFNFTTMHYFVLINLTETH